MIFHLLLFDAREPERELEAFIELAVLDENSGFSSFLSACFFFFSISFFQFSFFLLEIFLSLKPSFNFLKKSVEKLRKLF